MSTSRQPYSRSKPESFGPPALGGFGHAVVAGARFQASLLRRNRGDLQFFVAVPLFAVIFLAIVKESGRVELLGNATLGAALIGLWGVSLFLAGETIAADRLAGTIELLIATPGRVWPMLCGRVVTICGFGLLTFVEAWLVAALVFGAVTVPAHPVLFVLSTAATIFTASGTATILAALFALSRNTMIARNSLSYPLYILGGVVVPVSMLPDWLQWLARLCYLSWCSDLLRDSLRAGPVSNVMQRIGVILLLGVVGFFIGYRCLSVVLSRGRLDGKLGYR